MKTSKDIFAHFRIPSLLCIFCAALLLVGCGSSKKVTTGTADQNQAKVRYEAAVGNNFSFECLQSKVKYSLAGKSLNGKLNIEHGKRLCMTATVMGIEVARVEANQETVYIVDKFDKVYAEISIAEAAAHLGLQDEAKLETIEALLLGRIYLPGKGEAKASDFKSFVWDAADDNLVSGLYVAQQYNLTYLLNAENELYRTEVEVPSKAMTCTWSYSDMQQAGNGKMPATETLCGKSATLDISAQITLGSPTISKKGWTSFSPTSSYKKVSVHDLFQMIKNMKN